MKKNLEVKFVVSLIFAILVAIFAIQNAVAVEINFLFARFTISQALIILISAIVGAIVVLMISLMNQMSQRKQNKELTKEVERLNEDIENLKVIIDEFNQDDEVENSHDGYSQQGRTNDHYESDEALTNGQDDDFENTLNNYISDEKDENNN